MEIAAVGWRAGRRMNSDGTIQSESNGLYRSVGGAPNTFVRLSEGTWRERGPFRVARLGLGSCPGGTRIGTVTEPEREDDAPLEREVREAARGESERTPALVIGGVGALIAVVVAVVAVAAFPIWWLV